MYVFELDYIYQWNQKYIGGDEPLQKIHANGYNCFELGLGLEMETQSVLTLSLLKFQTENKTALYHTSMACRSPFHISAVHCRPSSAPLLPVTIAARCTPYIALPVGSLPFNLPYFINRL